MAALSVPYTINKYTQEALKVTDLKIQEVKHKMVLLEEHELLKKRIEILEEEKKLLRRP